MGVKEYMKEKLTIIGELLKETFFRENYMSTLTKFYEGRKNGKYYFNNNQTFDEAVYVYITENDTDPNTAILLKKFMLLTKIEDREGYSDHLLKVYDKFVDTYGEQIGYSKKEYTHTPSFDSFGFLN